MSSDSYEIHMTHQPPSPSPIFIKSNIYTAVARLLTVCYTYIHTHIKHIHVNALIVRGQRSLHMYILIPGLGTSQLREHYFSCCCSGVKHVAVPSKKHFEKRERFILHLKFLRPLYHGECIKIKEVSCD